MLEIAAERKKLDGLDIVVDSDPNKVTMTGQMHPAPTEPAPTESARMKTKTIIQRFRLD